MGEHTPIPLPDARSLIERVSSGLAFAAPPRREPAPALEPAGVAASRPVAGVRHAVDRERLREQGFIVPGDPVSALLEELRLIKRPLLLAAAQSRAGHGAAHGERILVASAMPGEGKTFAAVNLALAIAAEKDNEVLLVDADFAKPSVLSALGLPGGPGLMDAIADPSVRVEDCVLHTDVPGLSVLPAGQSTVADTEFLASARTAQVLEMLSANAPNRLIIFDSSPALAASPAAELAAHAGQVLVVVRADRTGEAALADALTLLSACPDRKLLLNGAAFSPTGRKFGAYYGYGG